MAWLPVPRKAAAQASSVAPVVHTSSITRGRRPAHMSPQALKAPRTLSWRSRAVKPTWGAVSRMRANPSLASGRPVWAANAWARSPAWLKPRSRWRFGWRGTGTIRSAGRGWRSQKVAISAASGPARSSRPVYLNAWTAWRSGPTKSAAERTASSEGGAVRHQGQAIPAEVGRPHRAQNGPASSQATWATQRAQKRVPARPQPPQVGG